MAHDFVCVFFSAFNHIEWPLDGSEDFSDCPTLNNELKEMKSQFVEKRAYLMELKMESRVTESLREKGIKPAKTPPLRLVIESKEQ